MLQGFLVGGLGKVVAELGVELAVVGGGVGVDGFGNFFQGLQMRGGIALVESSVGDGFEPTLEEVL